MPLDAVDDHFQRDEVLTALGDDDVCVFLAGLHVELVHGLNGGQILVDDGVDAPPALLDVPPDPAAQAPVGVGVDEDADVHLVAERLVDEDHDALDHDDPPRLDVQELLRPVEDGIVVGRAVDGLPVFEHAQMVDHHVGVEGVRMIIVELAALLKRMNGICAGGTGSFIDQMATLLKTDAAGLNEYAKNYKAI